MKTLCYRHKHIEVCCPFLLPRSVFLLRSFSILIRLPFENVPLFMKSGCSVEWQTWRTFGINARDHGDTFSFDDTFGAKQTAIEKLLRHSFPCHFQFSSSSSKQTERHKKKETRKGEWAKEKKKELSNLTVANKTIIICNKWLVCPTFNSATQETTQTNEKSVFICRMNIIHVTNRITSIITWLWAADAYDTKSSVWDFPVDLRTLWDFLKTRQLRFACFSVGDFLRSDVFPFLLVLSFFVVFAWPSKQFRSKDTNGV